MTTRSAPFRILTVLASVALLGAFALAQSSGSTSQNASANQSGSSANAFTSPGYDPSGHAITIAQAVVNGEIEQVLATDKGQTLYYSTQDSAKHAACSGSCLESWQPYAPPSGTLTGPSNLTKFLSTLQGPNGNTQVEVSGHPLYTYVKDTKFGQAKGVGTGPSWHVATPYTVNETY